MKGKTFISVLLAIQLLSVYGLSHRIRHIRERKPKLNSISDTLCPAGTSGLQCILENDVNSWCIQSTPPMI